MFAAFIIQHFKLCHRSLLDFTELLQGMVFCPLQKHLASKKEVCQNSNAATCCWHRDRQYFDKSGNCVQGDCTNQNPSDDTDLCWIEDDSGEIFPYPGDESENDLHCHGFAWARQDGDMNANTKWINLFFVSMCDHWWLLLDNICERFRE